MRPIYECWTCHRRFELKAPPISGTVCIFCGALYLTWVNYDEGKEVGEW